MVGGKKGGGSRRGMELVMDFAYDTGGTTLVGKMVRMVSFENKNASKYHCDKAGPIAMLAPPYFGRNGHIDKTWAN